jgi:hypothetical protein
MRISAPPSTHAPRDWRLRCFRTSRRALLPQPFDLHFLGTSGGAIKTRSLGHARIASLGCDIQATNASQYGAHRVASDNPDTFSGAIHTLATCWIALVRMPFEMLPRRVDSDVVLDLSGEVGLGIRSIACVQRVRG